MLSPDYGCYSTLILSVSVFSAGLLVEWRKIKARESAH